MAQNATRCTLKKRKCQKTRKTCKKQKGSGLFDTKGEKFYKEILIKYKSVSKYIIKYMEKNKLKSALKKILDDRHDDIEEIKKNLNRKIEDKINGCKSTITNQQSVINRGPMKNKNKLEQKTTIEKNVYNQCISSLVNELNQMKAVTSLQTGQQQSSTSYQHQQYYTRY